MNHAQEQQQHQDQEQVQVAHNASNETFERLRPNNGYGENDRD